MVSKLRIQYFKANVYYPFDGSEFFLKNCVLGGIDYVSLYFGIDSIFISS